MAKFADIISRAEEVRRKLGYNKSQFSARFGMKPQTYNNFIGSQGSKPNVELIYGIVREFNVNPLWLLEGSGEIFDRMERASIRDVMPMMSSRMTTPGSNATEISALMAELDTVLAPYYQNQTPVLQKKTPRNQAVEHAIQVIVHNFFISPVGTAGQVMEMLEQFRRVSAEKDYVASRNPPPATEEGEE